MDAPDEVWGTTDKRFDPKNFMFRYVNVFRVAVWYSMKATNPNLLMPLQSTIPNVTKPPKSLLRKIRKMAIKKNRRMYYRNQNKRFGWSKNYLLLSPLVLLIRLYLILIQNVKKFVYEISEILPGDWLWLNKIKFAKLNGSFWYFWS